MSNDAPNPLLEDRRLPAFSAIEPEHVVPAMETLIARAREGIQTITAPGNPPSWSTVAAPVQKLNERIERAWSPVAHLHAVADTPALRGAYQDCLPRLTAFAAELAQDEALCRAYRALADSEEHDRLDEAKQRVVSNALREFRLGGVELEPAAKDRFREIASRLAMLSNQFNENVLDATQGWYLHVTDPARLDGIPQAACRLARERAEREGVEGYAIGLDFPAYQPSITYASDRELRRELYEAYTTRGSDQGPCAGQWDNGEVMDEIVALRAEQAALLGFGNYAELSLARKMATSTGQVTDFLELLVRRSRPVARRELETLRAFAAERLGLDRVEAWDIGYVSEKLREDRFALSQEGLRPYFPAPRVLAGLFEVARRVFGIEITPRDGVEVWDREVGFYQIRDAEQRLRGEFYLDLHARPGKRGGAWMADCANRMRDGDKLQLPVAFVTCNFAPPAEGRPTTLTHDETTTLFHEFGHALHHLLTRIDHPDVAGINGVPWDAVELPSQLMENWCWEPEALTLMSAHVDTGEPLPADTVERLRATRTHLAGMQMIRQLEFATFDWRLHLAPPTRGGGIQALLEQVRDDVAVVEPPASNRFAHAFTHIFGGGYAAGYYSYKWAEALSSDAYSRFEEDGTFDRAAGQDFLRTVLEHGGARDAMGLFVEFRGREPTVDALLRHHGIETGPDDPGPAPDREGANPA